MALAAIPAPATAVSTVGESEACQYSYDQYWRTQPVTLSGTLRRNGTELAPGETLAPGDQVSLTGGRVVSELADWVAPFALSEGIIPRGDGSIPVTAWVALEATSTAEGITAPIRVQTAAISHVDETPSGPHAYFEPIVADLPTQTWTATGGSVRVRQAPSTRMAAIPAGRTGNDVRVNGTLFVSAQLSSSTRLFLDCAPGDPAAEGSTHTDRLFPTLSLPIPAPGWSASVGGSPVTGPVDADLETTALPRAAAGTAATVSGTTLRLRLTPAQRLAWLGSTGSATVSGSLPLTGVRAQQGAASAAVTGTAAATGDADVVLTVADSTWTPTGADGVDVRTGRVLELTATGPAGTRVLRLERIHASDPYPFAYVIGPDPRVRFDEEPPTGPTTDDPPPIDLGGGTIAPPPVLHPAPVVVPPTPKPATKVNAVKIGAFTLRPSRGRVTVTLQNLLAAGVTKGRFSLVTKARYRVGTARKARRIALLKATSFALPKGTRKGFSVRLTKDAVALLKGRRSVKATLTVTPAAERTQKVVSGTVTVRR